MQSPAATAYLLDLSDLFHGIGRGPMTGINRVGYAYLEELLRLEVPVFGFIHHQRGVVLLNRAGMVDFAQALAGRRPWDAPGLRGTLLRALPPEARCAYVDLRRRAADRCLAPGFARMLRRTVPPGTVAILTGLGNLRRPVFKALHGVDGLRIAVVIHDTIPLDFPQFVPVGGKKWFATRLEVVSADADRVIYNSAHSRTRAELHMAGFGRVPPGIVAHLGVTPLRADPNAKPAFPMDQRPNFVILGTIEPRKNHALLLDIWEAFARDIPVENRPRLLIVGTRGWRNEPVFRRLDTAPMMGRDVVELSGLRDDAVAALVQGARGLLFPSHCEGFGLPAIEAASLGTPVICNDLAVYREFLGAYPTYVPVEDPEGWKDAILRLSTGTTPQPTPPPIPTWQAHFDAVLEHL